MKYRVIIENPEIESCERCPFREYDHALKKMWCVFQEDAVQANTNYESTWVEAIAELMLKCPLEVVE